MSFQCGCGKRSSGGASQGPGAAEEQKGGRPGGHARLRCLYKRHIPKINHRHERCAPVAFELQRRTARPRGPVGRWRIITDTQVSLAAVAVPSHDAGGVNTTE